MMLSRSATGRSAASGSSDGPKGPAAQEEANQDTAAASTGRGPTACGGDDQSEHGAEVEPDAPEAFQRANRNAGKKGVRGVVGEDKLLTANPWRQFTWVEGTDTPIRQFAAVELVGVLDFLEERWQGVPVAAQAVKMLLWSCCRKLEVEGNGKGAVLKSCEMVTGRRKSISQAGNEERRKCLFLLHLRLSV